MASFLIHPSTLHGRLITPPSKSHTLRAILFAALAQGTSTIEDYLPSPDTFAMIGAVEQLGATVAISPHTLTIEGTSGNLKTPEDVITCDNSGQVLRFVGALSGLLPHYALLTGDTSIRTLRPVQPLLDALTQLGAFAKSSRENGQAPLIIKGPWTHTHATIDGKDSQPISGLLIAGAIAPHPLELTVTDPGEKPWIDLTLSWFKKLHIPYTMKDYTFYRMEGSAKIPSFYYKVPGDFSTAAFPIGAALITRSELTLTNIDMEDIQGDKALIFALQKMGAIFDLHPQEKTLTVRKGPPLHGIALDLNDFIDALPILAVIACFATSPTHLYNAEVARRKESDRISAITSELCKMGAKIKERPDGLLIHPAPLQGATVDSHLDHRIGLSLAVGALGASSTTLIQRTECIAKTYPRFLHDFQSIGAKIQ